MDPGATNVLRTNGKERRSVTFRFFPNGTSTTAMTVASGQLYSGGGVTSVTRDNSTAGTFLVQLSEVHGRLVGMTGTVQLSSVADLKVQFGDYDASAKTIVVRTIAVATPTDISDDVNNSVSVTLEFEEAV